MFALRCVTNRRELFFDDLQKSLMNLSFLLVGAVGIEPTTSPV
jgi:hypothetical protein